jgi:hypothetical protein
MKKNLSVKSAIKAMLLQCVCSTLLLTACKKSSNNNVEPAASKTGSFSAKVAGVAVGGTQFIDESYITTNDEFLEMPYAEIHIAGGNNVLDIMLANPAVKQYSLGVANSEAGVNLVFNGVMYEATSAATFNIIEATQSKISGTIAGTFKNVTNSNTIQVTEGNFTAQF